MGAMDKIYNDIDNSKSVIMANAPGNDSFVHQIMKKMADQVKDMTN